MAPRLPLSKLELISDMIQSQSLTTSQMADAAECSEHSIKEIRKNLHQFGNGLPRIVSAGDEVHITPPTLEALCDHLLEKPGLYCEKFIFTIYWNLLECFMDVVGIIVVVLSHGEAIALARHSFFPNPSLYACQASPSYSPELRARIGTLPSLCNSRMTDYSSWRL